MLLFSGTTNKPLAEKVASGLNMSLSDVEIDTFADGEIYTDFKTNVRHKDIIFVQSVIPSQVNNNLLELFNLVHTAKRYGARFITCVLPYLPYSRQDRLTTQHGSVTIMMIMQILQNLGVDEILVVDPHSPSTSIAFNKSFSEIRTNPVISQDIKDNIKSDTIVVAPDLGAFKQNKTIADELKLPIAVIDKDRSTVQKDRVQANQVFGDVKNKNVIIIDDIISTGSTLIGATNLLLDQGAASVRAIVTHGILTGDSLNNLQKSNIESIKITDSINNIDKIKNYGKFSMLTIGNLIAGKLKEHMPH